MSTPSRQTLLMAPANILIVEDESIVALGIQEKLQRLGYVVTGIVGSGEEALQSLEHSLPDLVLMDIKLNGEIDGIETAHRIRNSYNLPILYLTAYANSELLQRAKKTLPCGYVTKPFQEKVLYANIELSLHKYQEEQKKNRSLELETTRILAGGIAHQLNNLLMGIHGYAYLLDTESDLLLEHRGMLESIQKLVQRGGVLGKKLLGLAQSGKYQTQVTDLNQLIEECLTDFIFHHDDLSFQTDYARNLWLVNVEQEQIKHIFQELFKNALEAMHNGGKITLKTENVILKSNTLLPDTLEPGDYVRVTIKDQGPGMKVDVLQNPFYTTKSQGIGMGLPFVFGVIANHKGGIALHNLPESGTCIDLYLPAIPS